MHKPGKSRARLVQLQALLVDYSFELDMFSEKIDVSQPATTTKYETVLWYPS